LTRILVNGTFTDRRPATSSARSRVTPLGQNVNSYGRSFGDRAAFGKLLRAVGAVPGIERVRFTSPHPRDFTDDVVTAMAQTPTVCPSLHIPLQSGSNGHEPCAAATAATGSSPSCPGGR
jgi:tRNA-2-methylthio-N6-dimethylallyladenosine synthase